MITNRLLASGAGSLFYVESLKINYIHHSFPTWVALHVGTLNSSYPNYYHLILQFILHKARRLSFTVRNGKTSILYLRWEFLGLQRKSN